MTDLDRIILNFLNENKLYPTNIVNNLTKKLGDSSNETLNKLAIFGLFRQAPPFNTIKDINQLQSLDQLNDLFDKWKESALQQLVGSRGELKGNKTASMTYLDAYINNIASLGNNAKPFSYKDTEQTLIDVCNNNNWIKSNGVATQTYGVEKPHDSDIMFEDDNILILKGSSKAKCISYGQGYSWCISQTQLNYYNHYRITNGATIYFVLNKKLPKDDKERVCVILRYSGDKYGIADKTNNGKRSGGPEVAGDGFNYVEGELPWLKGMEKYFPESEVTQSERDYEAAISISYYGDDLGNYIINKSKELNFNGEEVDPVDFLRDYLVDKYISDEQFASLTEPMKVQVIEMGKELSNEIITNLSSSLKVRYAVIRLSNKYEINLGLYSDEERGRVFNNLKDKLNKEIISSLLRYTPEEQRYDLVKQIFPLVKDKLDSSIISSLLSYTPSEQRYDLVKQILHYVKDKLNWNIIGNLLNYIPKEQIYDLDKENPGLINQILPLVKDKLDSNIISSLLSYTPSEQKFELVKQIFPLVKDKLNWYIIRNLLNNTPSGQRYDLVKQILPLVKDKLDNIIIEKLLEYTPYDEHYNLVLQILPYVKDKLDSGIISKLLFYTPKEDKQEVQTLIDKYQQKDVVNELRLMVRKILKENYQ